MVAPEVWARKVRRFVGAPSRNKRFLKMYSAYIKKSILAGFIKMLFNSETNVEDKSHEVINIEHGNEQRFQEIFENIPVHSENAQAINDTGKSYESNKDFFKLKISITAKLIKFSFIEKLHIGPRMVIGY